MMIFRYAISALLLTFVAGCGSTSSSSSPDGLQQSGSWVVREDQVMRVAAGTSGQGTLLFQGWQYPFSFTGAKVSVTGASNGDIEGEVYNLERPSDFEGTYYPKPELNKADQVTGFWAQNDKGVTLYMRIQGENISMNLSAEGATVTLIK